MKLDFKSLVCFITSFLFCSTVWSADFYLNALSETQGYNTDPTTRSQLLSIFEMCGSPNDIDDGCIIAALQDTTVKINDPKLASSILNGYQAIRVSNMQKSECVNDALATSNEALGKCYFAMQFHIFDQMDPETTKAGFTDCLMRELGISAFQGNIVAQYRLMQIASLSGRAADAAMWKESVQNNADTDLYQFLVNCY